MVLNYINAVVIIHLFTVLELKMKYSGSQN